MKTYQNILILLLGALSINAFAQGRVALHSEGTTTIFSGANPFLDAYNAAVDGDTIYLPGGNLPYPTTINKGLVIYGAGHYPDFASVTSPTVLTGGLVIGGEADNLKLEGIQVNGNLVFADNQKVDSVRIRRCRIVGDLNYSNFGGTTFCEFNEFYQCVIGGSAIFTNCRNSFFTNNIVQQRIFNATDLGISNNIVFYSSFQPVVNANNCFFAGNIFFYNGSNFYTGGLNTFTHNVFPGTPGVGNSIFENNYNQTDLSGFFINQSGATFQYDQDYNLADPAAYPGVDGTEVGIFGGLFPYKTGAVPENPHFIFKDIDVQTNQSGQLNVNIQVEAQNE